MNWRNWMRAVVPRSFDDYIIDVVRRDLQPRKAAMEKIFEFVRYNQIPGDYLEFGCSGAHTFRLAFDRIQKIGRTDTQLYAFDSFQGLPEPTGVDVHPDFHHGQFAQSRQVFEQRLRRYGIPGNRYRIVEGFYEQTLTTANQRALPIKQAAVVWIDCDLYESAKAVLGFITPYLQTGTVLAFDDFFCFNGDPQRGEQRAFLEWRQEHPRWQFSDYFQFDWAGKAFIAKQV